MSCSKPAPWETSFPYTSSGERCALSWFGPVGSTILFYIFYLFIYFCKLRDISHLIPWLPGCPVPGLPITSGNPARTGAEIAFWGGPISCCMGSGSSEMSWKATLVRNEMWWTSDFYWHAAQSWQEQLVWHLLNPMFSGWESDPVLSVRNDTDLLDDAA